MNTDTGTFEEIGAAPSWATRISVGEIVKLKGEECRVVKIDTQRVVLKLLSFQDRMNEAMSDVEPRNRHERRRAESLAKKVGR